MKKIHQTKNKTKYLDLDEELRFYNEILHLESEINSTKFSKLLFDLKTYESDKVLNVVSQLCTQMSLAEEVCFIGFRVEQFLPCLIACLNRKFSPDIIGNQFF